MNEEFEGFGDFDPAEHEDEARERWGDSKAYAESAVRAGRYTKDDWKQMTEEAESINQRLAELMVGGAAPDAVECMDAAEAHRQHIDRWFYSCSLESHVGLGEMYVADPRFTRFWEGYQPGLAAFARDAFRANAERQTG